MDKDPEKRIFEKSEIISQRTIKSQEKFLFSYFVVTKILN